MTASAPPRGSGGDFEVDTALIASEAEALNAAGDELAAATRPLLKLAAASVEIFGEEAAAAAYANFFSRWKPELSTQVSALHELAGSVRDSAHRYDFTDNSNAGALRGFAGAIGQGADDPTQPFGRGSVGDALDTSTTFPGQRPR